MCSWVNRELRCIGVNKMGCECTDEYCEATLRWGEGPGDTFICIISQPQLLFSQSAEREKHNRWCRCVLTDTPSCCWCIIHRRRLLLWQKKSSWDFFCCCCFYCRDYMLKCTNFIHVGYPNKVVRGGVWNGNDLTLRCWGGTWGHDLARPS